MSKINRHIEIVSSSKSYLSSMSAKSRQAIYDILSRQFDDVGITLVENLDDLKNLVKTKPDLVFLGMKFVPSNPTLGINDPNKIWLSDYLEAAGITCTGSTSQAHQLDINKQSAKIRVAESGLRTSPFLIVDHRTLSIPNHDHLNYPLFVKPANRGGGLGIDADSVVYTEKHLANKVQQIAEQHQSDSLVEEFLPGREFSVAILRQTHNMQYQTMPIELVVEADDQGVAMLAGAVKSNNQEQVSTIDDPALRAAVSGLAIDSFKALGGRDYGRIDIRLDANDRPTFLEANLIPSLIRDYGSFPKSCALNLKLSQEDMIMSIAKLAMARQEANEALSSHAAIQPFQAFSR